MQATILQHKNGTVYCAITDEKSLEEILPNFEDYKILSIDCIDGFFIEKGLEL